MTPSPLQSPSQPVSLDDAAPGTKLLGRAGLATTGVTEEVTEEVPALTVPKRGMSLPKNVRVKSNPISKGIAAVKEAALLDKAARVITVAATRGTVTETPVRKASAKVAAGKKVATSSKVNKNTKTTNEANEEDSQSSESEDEGDKEETEVTVDSKGINQTLHPIHDIKEIFKEITKSADALGFAAVAEYLGARKLNIATMCSGTESPILALDMIKKSLPALGYSIDFDHVFSAEIEAYKQAYIERNFQTNIIFRDVREIASSEKASTAYGADEPVPKRGVVDVLVAGFACVDFSNLNRHRKGLDGELTKSNKGKKAKVPKDGNDTSAPKPTPTEAEIAANMAFHQDVQRGESGDTMYAILAYAAKYRPPIVVLENVMGAPWKEIQEEWVGIGYAARFTKMDTKHYYIPHTRQRTYMLCIDKLAYQAAEPATEQVAQPTVVESADQVTNQVAEPTAGPSWLRPAEQVAEQVAESADRVTNQVAEQTARPPCLHPAEQAVMKWVELVTKFRRSASAPVDAFLLDESDPRLAEATMEITKASIRAKFAKEHAWPRTLIRHLEFREDCRLGNNRPVTQWMANGSSTMLDHGNQVWNKNQSNRVKDIIDLTWLQAAKYDYDTAFKGRYPDLSQNIDRHQPIGAWGLTGCLTPNGIPYSTFRGGPIVGYESLALQGIPINKLLLTRETNKQLQDLAGNAMTSTVVGIALASALIVGKEAMPKSAQAKKTVEVEEVIPYLKQKNTLASMRSVNFDTVPAGEISLLLSEAAASAQCCACEGQNCSIATSLKTYQCKDCLFLACEKCAGLPKHTYHEANNLPRKLPHPFVEHLKKVLPLRLSLTGNTSQSFLATLAQFNASTAKPRVNLDEFRNAVLPALSDEYRFTMIKRFKSWRVYYVGQRSRLELELTESQARWSLYANLEASLAVTAKLRKVLEMPIGEMLVGPTTLLDGNWRLCSPIVFHFELNLEGCAPLVPSWKARIGLDDFVQEKVWSSWFISAANGTESQASGLEGRYTLLPDCGTATNNLHRREPADAPVQKYLFLDVAQTTHPKEDRFVISSDHHRLRYGEHRMIDAILGQSQEFQNWRPNDHQGVQTVQCISNGAWIDSTLGLCALSNDVAQFAALKNSLKVSDVSAPICRSTNMVALSCEFDPSGPECTDWPSNDWGEIDQINERQVFAHLAWLTEKVRGLQDFSNEWREVAKLQHQHACNICSPKKPSIKWKLDKTFRVVPYEDAAEAGPYERAIKSRPPPILTHVRILDRKGLLEVSVNVVALVHRVIARMLQPGLTQDRPMQVHWKLDTHHDPTRSPNLPKLTLRHNKNETPLPHVFMESKALTRGGPKRELRLEQQRSLRWMVAQESLTAEPFLEEEVEEFVMGPLGWRLQARVRSPHLVRGGVLADKVGYGKTITMLALIESQKAQANITPVEGYIELKATLIVAPYLLLSQWKDEITQFLGRRCKVIIVRTMPMLNRQSIKSFQEADIILVSHTLLTDSKYLDRLGWFAARPEGPPATQTRAFAHWLQDAEKKTREHIEILKKSKTKQDLASFQEDLGTTLRNAESDEALLARVPTKRVKGRAYIKSKAKGNATASTLTEEQTNDDQVTDGHTAENTGADGGDLDENDQNSHGNGANLNKAGASTKKAASKRAAHTKSLSDDPFNLHGALEFVDLKGPLFQMFAFRRIIIDEYTYVKDFQVTPVLSIFAASRWVLSGTPRLDGFSEVKSVAALVGVSLEVEDNLLSSNKEKTDAEVFSSLIQTQSSDWHEQRHTQAQAFLDQFARQNVAEHDEIPAESLYHATEQHCAERAIYLELQTQLIGQDMQMARGSGANADSDHLSRLQDMISSSTCPEEALLKRCSIFEVTGDDEEGEINVLGILISTREAEYHQIRQLFLVQLVEAARMKQHCGNEETHYTRWLRQVERNNYGDYEATDKVIGLIKQAQESLTAPKVTDSAETADNAENADDAANTEIAETAKEPKVTAKDLKKLREKKVELHNLCLEFVTRLRMVRFFAKLSQIQQLPHIHIVAPFAADCCNRQFQRVDGLFLLALCGHTICRDCLNSPARGATCAVVGCNGPALGFHAIDAGDLTSRQNTISGPTHFGSKIANLVKLVKAITSNDEDDQILVFVQYMNVMDTITKAFTQDGVSFSKVTGAEGKGGVEDRAMKAFRGRKTDPKKNDKKTSVLLLNSSSSCAAGHNITNANHVIFVSPFFATDNHEFGQFYEQAVGRARRYGQKKTVHVYQFVCLDTIDVNVIEDGTKAKVVKTAGGGIDVKAVDQLTAAEASQDNGGVRFHSHRVVAVEAS